MCLVSYDNGSGDSSDMIAFVMMARDRATAMPHAQALRVFLRAHALSPRAHSNAAFTPSHQVEALRKRNDSLARRVAHVGARERARTRGAL